LKLVRMIRQIQDVIGGGAVMFGAYLSGSVRRCLTLSFCGLTTVVMFGLTTVAARADDSAIVRGWVSAAKAARAEVFKADGTPAQPTHRDLRNVAVTGKRSVNTTFDIVNIDKDLWVAAADLDLSFCHQQVARRAPTPGAKQQSSAVTIGSGAEC
jgi:hypothetical protein